MLRRLPVPAPSLLMVAIPLGAIALARLFTYTDWAEANTGWTAILFAWIVIDGLMLMVIAKAKDHRPALFDALSALALASLIILVGAAEPVRSVYLDLPAVLIAGAVTLALFAGWSSVRIVRKARSTGSWIVGFEQVFPKIMVRFTAAEIRVMVLGLFRWRVPADVPAGSKPFIYHTYLTPMITTLVALQVIELLVVHMLVMMWSPTVAWVLFALSVAGVIWTVALLKSFRIYPVLLTESAVRVRSGMIYDFEVPLNLITDMRSPFSSEKLDSKGILNLAIFSSPNVHLRFAEPVEISTLLGKTRTIEGVGLRLDDSAVFLKALGKSGEETREQK